MELIFPIVMLLICLIGGSAILLYANKNTKKKNNVSVAEKTAIDFVNIKDIRGNFLYTLDGLVCSYIRLTPVSTELFSEQEKKSLTNILTAELSAEKEEFKFLAVSRPVDIKPLIDQYAELMRNTTNKIQRELLKKESYVLSNYALSGEVVERQFYIMLWSKYSDSAEADLDKRTREIINRFENAGIKSEFISQQEILKLCNLINNPSYVHIEDADFDATIPILTAKE